VIATRDIANLKLERYPKRPKETLQAWDAADTLLLRHVADRVEVPGVVLIVNDAWGALTTATADLWASILHRPARPVRRMMPTP